MVRGVSLPSPIDLRRRPYNTCDDSDDDNCDFIDVDLCVVSSFAAKICNISALTFFGYDLVWE